MASAVVWEGLKPLSPPDNPLTNWPVPPSNATRVPPLGPTDGVLLPNSPVMPPTSAPPNAPIAVPTPGMTDPSAAPMPAPWPAPERTAPPVPPMALPSRLAAMPPSA